MIYSLKGIVTEKNDDFAVIEVSGVGYQVFLPEQLVTELDSSRVIKIYIYHHIREDHQTLFGFKSRFDRDFFMMLTSVSGVGPKVGIRILSGIDIETFCAAILSEKLGVLTQVPGIGKKMAERLIVELKDKIAKMDLVDVSNRVSMSPTPIIHQDLLAALKSLGYSHEEIKRAVSNAKDALSAGLSVEQGIRVVLKNMS